MHTPPVPSIFCRALLARLGRKAFIYTLQFTIYNFAHSLRLNAVQQNEQFRLHEGISNGNIGSAGRCGINIPQLDLLTRSK